VIAGNLNAAGLSLSSNVVSALNSTSNITTTANIAANYFIGNGSLLTGIDATSIQNGNSNVKVYANANVATSVNGVANVLVVTDTGLNITGLISATGNVTSGNVNTANLSLSGNIISPLNVTGNITGGNIISIAAISGASVSASGNVTGANVNGTTVSATGNVQGANVNATTISATGNVNGGNVNTNTIVGTGTTVKSTGDLTLSASGNIVVSNNHINNLANPVQDQDAATKYYVDTVAQGLDAKASVHTATTAALPAYTYNNGTSGVGATLTGTATGTLTIAGDTILFGQRVLIKDETGAFVNNTTMSAAFNGIYVCTTEGAVGVAYVLTRAADFDVAAEMYSAFTFVETGTGVADTGWVCTNNIANPITVGTTEITFTQFSGAGSIHRQHSGWFGVDRYSVFNAKVDQNTTAFDGSGNIIVKAGANLTTPNIGAATGTSLSTAGNITGNVIFGNTISTTGNVIAGNVNTGNISLSGNVISNLNVTGNATAGNIISVAAINGASVSASGNVNGGNVITAGAVSAASVSASGNITAGNISTSGASGNITGANVISAVTLSASGNVVAGNLNAAGLSLSSNVVSSLNVTGDIAGANVTTPGLISATGNITGGNLITSAAISAASVSASGNVQVPMSTPQL
jgi:hypothetical protein